MIPNPIVLVPIETPKAPHKGTAIAKLVLEDGKPLDVRGMQYDGPSTINENSECEFRIRLVEISHKRRFRLAVGIDFTTAEGEHLTDTVYSEPFQVMSRGSLGTNEKTPLSPEHKLKKLQKQLSSFQNDNNSDNDENSANGKSGKHGSFFSKNIWSQSDIQEEPEDTEEDKMMTKRAIEDASLWNIALQFERSHRSPFYYDNHTRTTQVLGSWQTFLKPFDEKWLKERERISQM